jgi:hypothetical protein
MLPIDRYIHSKQRVEKQFSDLSVVSGWSHLLTSNGCEVDVAVKSPSALLVRSSYNLPIPFDMAVRLLRPEAMCVPENPMVLPFCKECQVLKTLAPGDVICSMQFRSWFLAQLRLLATTSWGFDSKQMWMRLQLRRDFPSLGEVSVVMVDLSVDPQGSILALDCGIVVSKTNDESVVLIQEMFEMPRLPSWLLKLVLSSYCRTCAIAEVSCKNISSLVQQSLEESGFLVVTLKKCCRGFPLVPSLNEPGKASEDFQWDSPDSSSCFSLSNYLQHILNLCAIGPNAIFDSLDGRRLVPFQAAVRRVLWPRLWETLEPIFRKQRAAYRQHHGGSGAPQIQVDVPPRFCHEPAYPAEMLEDDASTDDGIVLKHKNTFLHFATRQDHPETSSSR